MANEPTQTTNEEAPLAVNKTSKLKSKRFVLLFILPLIIVVGSVFLYLNGGRYIETENAYVKADKTPINAEVAGRVINVPVEENQHVKKGDLLVQLDPKPYKYAVDRAQANLEDVRTSLETLKAEYQSKLANIDVAKSQLDYARLEEKRQYNLRQKNYSSESDYDSARQKTLLFELQINALQKGLKQVAESLGGDPEAPVELHPKYQLAMAELDQAKNDLLHVNVYAPNDGVVSKVLEEGQFITSNSTTMLLVSDKDLWIEANFTEKEMTNIRVGQTVDIEIDYAPGHQWTGKVTSISPATGSEFSVIPAQNATGNWVKVTQRLPIRISIEAKENIPTLRAGLSAVVTVDTEHQRHLSL